MLAEINFLKSNSIGYLAELKSLKMSEKEKLEMEFILNTSPRLLFNYLATPSGLSEWFADDVNPKNGYFSFSWNGAAETAKLLKKHDEQCIRFQWESDAGTDFYWEFAIEVDELTKDISLIVTDFAARDEIEESRLFWQNRIEELKQIIGH